MCWPMWVLCLSSWKDWHAAWCLTWTVRPAGFPTSLSLSSSLTLLPWLSVFVSRPGQCLLWARFDPRLVLVPPCLLLSSPALCAPSLLNRVSCPIMLYFCDGLFASSPFEMTLELLKAPVLCAHDLQITVCHAIKNSVFYGICDICQLWVYHYFMCTKKNNAN